ncbi:unnamed protein product [Cyclocybe aegerita]|uniref:Uncharacterized protein n=1 Tax=Cyclocybe aegerita TaxID=1973307 RepID=A0A8S0X3D7_CYCAE|nr:unnamed protein product [Cyclocybe aegerita]
MSFDADGLFFKTRRRHLYTACLSLVLVSLVSVLASSFWTARTSSYPVQVEDEIQAPAAQEPIQQLDKWHSLNYLKGAPTDSLRDNLRPDVKYISSWISAGWTNDVMTYINLIYLGFLTKRAPIIAMFTPSHIGGHVPPVDFGEVFDVPRLREALQMPVIEWHEVKNRNSGVLDEIGCWDTWQAVQDREHYPRRSVVPDLLKLDISYTKAPSWIKVIPNYEHDQHSSFSALATLAFPETRNENAVEPMESPQHRVKLPTDQQLLCYDYLYYVCSHQPFEFDYDYSPAWLFVGQHMHWTPRLESLADQYVRSAFGLQEKAETPPYIGIHIRHGDFANWCGTVPVEECFAPISVIARRVEEVKLEILERRGIEVNHVIMTSDERNATWWEEVTAQGWFGIDHSKTVELYGAWSVYSIVGASSSANPEAGTPSLSMLSFNLEESASLVLIARRCRYLLVVECSRGEMVW